MTTDKTPPVPNDVADNNLREMQEAQKHIEFLDKAFFYADQGGAFSGYGQKGIKKAIDTLRQFIIRAASTPSAEVRKLRDILKLDCASDGLPTTVTGERLRVYLEALNQPHTGGK